VDSGYDLVILGSGAGGLTAALTASLLGARPLVIERSDVVGGTTAVSSGTAWIPGNRHQQALGSHDDPLAARTYLNALAGDSDPAGLRDAFLDAGPRMIDMLHEQTRVRFRAFAASPDYRQELPGAAQGGRPLEPLPFDGRALHGHFQTLRSPIRELMLLGGMMVTRGEAAQLVRAHRSVKAMAMGARLLLRYALDRIDHRRGTRLVLGNALVARLYAELLARKVPVRVGVETLRLDRNQSRVKGVVIASERGTRTVRANHGVVLAGGGFPASAELRKRYLPSPVATHSPACETCVGSTITLAQAVGADLGAACGDNALWFPSSIATRHDGSSAVYPHIALDRSKPGLIAVNSAGRRFVNEAVSYHEFVRAMYRSNAAIPTIPAFLICDRRFIRRYGLGIIRPRTLALHPYRQSGYLFMEDSLERLAKALEVDAAGLVETVARNNEMAASGCDEDFGKGTSSYDRHNGDASVKPNPCLGAIDGPGFCAVKVVPTPLGTSLGLRTDAQARVLAGDGVPVDGLYAVGNDMHSIMRGEYPGPGAQIGVAMTFGFIAAQHALRARDHDPGTSNR
jgi:succinate dehydrogenase/fumarate reductase flavoprotein subunit